jgi:predicted chitinase
VSIKTGPLGFVNALLDGAHLDISGLAPGLTPDALDVGGHAPSPDALLADGGQGDRLPVDAETQLASRSRAVSDPQTALMRQALHGGFSGMSDIDMGGGIALSDAVPTADALLAGLMNAFVESTIGHVMQALDELGIAHGGSIDDPATQRALADLKGEMGFPPIEGLDLEAILALLMKSAEQDRARQAPSRSGGSSSSSGGGSGAARSSGGASGGAATSGAPKSTSGASGTSQNRATAPVDTKNWKPGAGDVTPAQLQRIVPSLTSAKAAEVAPHLNRAMKEANISTPERKAAFIAQLAHESGGFKYNQEIASGAAYEGRRDLGNTQPGDGKRFKGRGYIQLTGRANYAAAGKALGLDLVNNPELAAKPENAARVAAWYWNSRGLNKLADQGNFDGITKRINGGYNGKADRDAYHARALRAGLPDGVPSTGTFVDAPSTNPAQPTSTAGTGATGKVAPSSMSEAEKYDHYKKIIEAQGGRVNETPGQRNLLGLRQETNTNANGGQGVYDDKMVMLWKDASGTPRVREYQANTEPSARYRGRMGQDVNGDGRLDQGRLSTGTYEYGFSTYRGGPALAMIGDSQVERDTNQDGLFNDGRKSGGGNSMLFHVGGNNMTGSAGCQTMPPAEYDRFWRDLTRDGKSARLNYTLVNM